MMSSMGSTRGNPRGSGGREKSSAKTSAQTSGKSSSTGEHPAPVGKKATPDQMRMAQIYSDGTNEENTREKIRQVQDVVPKSEDEVLVALHDSNYDTEKAINLLLERGEGDQQGEWETISSRKSKQRGVSSGFRNNSDVITNSKDNGLEKEGGGRDRRDNRGNKDRESKDKDRDRDGHKDFGGRDRDGDRERGGFGSRGRGRNNRGQLPPRMARGRGRENDSTSREREKNERNRWDGGESGRGRGRRGHDHMNGPSRRGRGPRSFTNSKFGGGNSYEDDAFKPGDNVWTNPPAETENNTWDNSMVTEDWGAEDWSGDDAALNGGRTELPPTGGVGQPSWMTALTESKVFMASSTPPSTTPITLDSIESQSNAMPPSSSLTGNSALNAPVSMSPGSSLSAGTAGLAPAPGMPPSTMPEMSRGISLAELFAKPASAPPVNNQQLGGLGGSGLGSVGGGISVGGIGTSGMGTTGIGSAGAIGTSPGMGGLGNAIGSPAGMGSSSIGDTLSQRQTSSSVFSAYVDLKPPQAPVSEPSKAAGQVQQLGGVPSEPPSATVPASQLTTNQQPVQQRVQPQTSATKPSKKKLPPPSTKIPASAVEMPGPVPARGLGVLDVQFGAMDINMEPSLPDFEVGSISSANVPSTSMAVSVSLSSDAYNVSEPSSTASHLSYTTKVSDSSYPAPSINNTLMANSTSATTTMAPGLDQTSRSVYAQSAQNRQMTPDPIPLPTQDLKGSTYMHTQKPSPTPMDTKSDKQLSNQPGSHAPSHTTPLSALTSHPSSLASSSLASSLSSSSMSSSGGLHSQMGLSSHAPSHQSQSLGLARQTPNSYHGPTSASITSTAHAGSSGGYGSSSPTVTHPSSAYSSVHSNLGGPSTHSSAGLSSSSLTASGLPSGPSSISALSVSQSGLSSGGQPGMPGSVSGLSTGAQLSSTGQLPGSSQLSSGSQLNSSQLSSGPQLTAGGQLSSSSQLTGGSVQLSNSGHPPSSLSGSLNPGGLSASPTSHTHSTHTSVQTSPLTQGKLGGLDNRIHQGSNQHVLDHNSHQQSMGPGSLSSGALSSSASHPAASSSSLTTSASAFPGSTAAAAAAASALGFGGGSTIGVTMTTTTASAGIRATTMASGSKVPNLPPGMSFVTPNQQYIMGHGLPLVNAFAPHQPFYNYEEFQMQLSRMPAAATAMGYPYDLQQFQQPATTLTAARDVSSLSTAPYSVTEASKFTRGDASSPVAASSLSAQQSAQQPAQHATGSHHTQQAQQQPTLFNAAAAASIPPGYGYAGGLPYYPAGHAGILPPGLQYPPAAAVFPAVSTVQPSNRSQQATTPHSGFQQSAYGSHGAYGTGYDDLTQTQDFTKSGYSGVSQTQKTATGAAGRSSVGGSSAASASVGAADISGSSYTSKTHTPSFPDKQSFHGTPPPFSFPLASGTQAGPLNPAATAYPQHPFVPMLQHHNAAAAAILPQQLHGDSHAGSSQRSQGTSGPAKQTSKPTYGSTYWSAN